MRESRWLHVFRNISRRSESGDLPAICTYGGDSLWHLTVLLGCLMSSMYVLICVCTLGGGEAPLECVATVRSKNRGRLWVLLSFLERVNAYWIAKKKGFVFFWRHSKKKQMDYFRSYVFSILYFPPPLSKTSPSFFPFNSSKLLSQRCFVEIQGFLASATAWTQLCRQMSPPSSEAPYILYLITLTGAG